MCNVQHAMLRSYYSCLFVQYTMIELICKCSVYITYTAHSDNCMADPALQGIQRHAACLCGSQQSVHFGPVTSPC